jgi:hypothetical protein
VGADLHDRRPGNSRTNGFTITNDFAFAFTLGLTVTHGLAIADSFTLGLTVAVVEPESYANG